MFFTAEDDEIVTLAVFQESFDAVEALMASTDAKWSAGKLKLNQMKAYHTFHLKAVALLNSCWGFCFLTAFPFRFHSCRHKYTTSTLFFFFCS